MAGPRQLELAIGDGVRTDGAPVRTAPRGTTALSAPAVRRAAAEQLELALRTRAPVQVVAGGGAGSGHRRGRLTLLDGGTAPRRQLPTREEITEALLGALADMVGGRISPAAAAAIREAAEETLRQLEAAERDPHRAPQFARAARALRELLPRR